MKVSNSQERIKYILEYYNMSVPELSAKTGVGATAIYNYVKGIREPKQKAIALISIAFNIDPVWLMGYDVPMFKSEFADALDVIKEHDENKKLIAAYHRADDITKEMVRRILGI